MYHISVIDNVTRKLMQENKRPVAVGFFFSLGHSTIVIALTIAIAIASTLVSTAIPALKNAGGFIGTSVSALFLYLIAIMNMLVLWEIFQTFRGVRRGGGIQRPDPGRIPESARTYGPFLPPSVTYGG